MKIKKFKCSKCGKVLKFDVEKKSLINDCNCGWVYLKEIKGVFEDE